MVGRGVPLLTSSTALPLPIAMPAVKHDDPVHGWLGASPDGLIESLTLEAGWSPTSTSSAAAAGAGAGSGGAPWDAAAPAGVGGSGAAPWDAATPYGLPPQVAAAVAAGHGPLFGPGRGILEIKCPHNRGQPELAAPPQHATWYYMPQVRVGNDGCIGCPALHECLACGVLIRWNGGHRRAGWRPLATHLARSHARHPLKTCMRRQQARWPLWLHLCSSAFRQRSADAVVAVVAAF